MALKAIWAGSDTISRILIAISFFVCFYVMFPLAAVVIAGRLYGISMMSLVESNTGDLSNPDFIAALRFIQVSSSIGAFIMLALVLAYLFSKRPANYLYIDKKINTGSAIIVVVTMIASLPLINYLGELNSHVSLPSFLKELEDKAAEMTKALLDMQSVPEMLFNVFMIALLPAIGEELLFRGIIQKLFSEWTKNIHAGIWISAILFSAMHMQFLGFLPRMMLGALLGYLLVWSGSLWLPIIAHFVNNASIVMLMYFFQNGTINVDPDKLGTDGEMVSVVVSVIVVSGFLWLVHKNEKRKIYLTTGVSSGVSPD